MAFTTKLIAFLAFALAIFWFIYSPSFDSGVTATALLAAFLTSLFIKKKDIQPRQTQKVLGDGQGIQAGGDVHINKSGKD